MSLTPLFSPYRKRKEVPISEDESDTPNLESGSGSSEDDVPLVARARHVVSRKNTIPTTTNAEEPDELLHKSIYSFKNKPPKPKAPVTPPNEMVYDYNFVCPPAPYKVSRLTRNEVRSPESPSAVASARKKAKLANQTTATRLTRTRDAKLRASSQIGALARFEQELRDEEKKKSAIEEPKLSTRFRHLSSSSDQSSISASNPAATPMNVYSGADWLHDKLQGDRYLAKTMKANSSQIVRADHESDEACQLKNYECINGRIFYKVEVLDLTDI